MFDLNPDTPDFWHHRDLPPGGIQHSDAAAEWLSHASRGATGEHERMTLIGKPAGRALRGMIYGDLDAPIGADAGRELRAARSAPRPRRSPRR